VARGVFDNVGQEGRSIRGGRPKAIAKRETGDGLGRTSPRAVCHAMVSQGVLPPGAETYELLQEVRGERQAGCIFALSL